MKTKRLWKVLGSDAFELDPDLLIISGPFGVGDRVWDIEEVEDWLTVYFAQSKESALDWADYVPKANLGKVALFEVAYKGNFRYDISDEGDWEEIMIDWGNIIWWKLLSTERIL